MATGTGKTWTAIYSAKELLKNHTAFIVICAPYKHLVKQWAEDVEKVFPNANIILVSSENIGWDSHLNHAIIKNKYKFNEQIIVISTIASFKKDNFKRILDKSSEDKLLIVDEAHRFTETNDEVSSRFKYMLGLSATPFSGSTNHKGKMLMEFFGGKVFSLTIEDALEKGFLVPYRYNPIFVEATVEEEENFERQTSKIISCFKNGKCIDEDKLIKAIRARLRIISMAHEKIAYLGQIIQSIAPENHFIVYCGDGKLFDNSTGYILRHIQSVKRVLSGLNYKSSQFTATENINQRMELVDSFNKGDIDALVAIRCLDEGINIPSIKSALILSSNDDYREFVQRRGRILRLYPGKEFAEIYDVVVLPSFDNKNWAKIELRRFYEYAKLAMNWNETEEKLRQLLMNYGLEIDDIDVYDYENMEDELDE